MFAVTGASGFIGTGLMRAIATRDDAARAITRADWGNEQTLLAKLEGVHTVFHLAALAHRQGKARPDYATYHTVNVGLTEQLLNACEKAGVKHVIMLSTLSVYMAVDTTGELRADSPTNPGDDYGKTKLLADQLALDWGKRTGIRVTLVRPPLVYGTGAKGNFAKLVKIVSLPLPFGRAKAPRSFIARGNLVDALLFIAGATAALPQIILLRDPINRSLRELIASLARAQGKRAWLLPFPIGPLRAALIALGKKRLAHQLFSPLTVADNLTPLGWRAPSDGTAELEDIAQPAKREA